MSNGIAKIEGDQIVIRVNIADLPEIYTGRVVFDEIEIVDAFAFAPGVVVELNQEDPDTGLTSIQTAIDRAMDAAISSDTPGLGDRLDS